MKRAVISLAVVIPLSVVVGGCRPSQGELQQDEAREQSRAEAERAVGAKRLDETEREKEDAAVAAYHEWIMHAARDSGQPPRKYSDALQHVSLDDETLVLEISSDDKGTAIELCRLSLEEWPGRAQHGVSTIRVISANDDSTLAESYDTPTGMICE